MTIYDVGGGVRIRGIWKNYYAEVRKREREGGRERERDRERRREGGREGEREGGREREREVHKFT